MRPFDSRGELPVFIWWFLYLYVRSNSIMLLVQIAALLMFFHLSSVTGLFSIHHYEQKERMVTKNNVRRGEIVQGHETGPYFSYVNRNGVKWSSY
jgi:hypothetical protein